VKLLILGALFFAAVVLIVRLSGEGRFDVEAQGVSISIGCDSAEFRPLDGKIGFTFCL
jgi:hypothetical protein